MEIIGIVFGKQARSLKIKMELSETIEYRGKKIEIYYDENADGPGEWGNDGVFLVHYHKDLWVENKDIITKDELEEYFNNEKIEQAKKYHIFLVFAYIHGGVSLSLSMDTYPFTDKWDTSACGAVLVSKEEAKGKKKARELAMGLIKTWNTYLSGEIYGYQIEGEAGCWGFYGDIEESGLLEQAKSDIDIEIEDKQAKHLKRLKSYITNRVPINKRVAMIL